MQHPTAFKNMKSTLTFQKLLYTLYKDLHSDVTLMFSLGLDFVDLGIFFDFVDSTRFDFIILQQQENNIFSAVLRNTPNHLVSPTKITFTMIQVPFLVFMVCLFLLILPSCSRTFNIS